MNPFVVGIRFQKVGKIYHFDASICSEIKPGDFAVVETSRGRQLGQVIQIMDAPQPPPEGAWKPILRKATPHDLVLRKTWQQKEIEAMINCRAKAAELKVNGIKIVSAEFSFDGKRLSFLYSTEAGDKQDLRSLRRAMQRAYPQSQVEMHQIGPRDVAKILGGMGACGLENRCCSTFLTDFSPVSIKMAKDQGISLTPSEITGMCGRLRCCLVYEYEQYVEARKVLPKRGKRVVTPIGEGKVIDVYPLKDAVLVYVDGKEGSHEFLKHELQPWDELEALRRKSEAPCDRHEGGGCTCGKQGNGNEDGMAQLGELDEKVNDEHPAVARNTVENHTAQELDLDKDKVKKQPGVDGQAGGKAGSGRPKPQYRRKPGRPRRPRGQGKKKN